MAVYRNADVHTRVWPTIQRPDGRTLELAPDEEAELELPDDFVDSYLQTGPRRRKRPKTNATPETESPETPTTTETTEQNGDGDAPDDDGGAGSSDVALETPKES